MSHAKTFKNLGDLVEKVSKLTGVEYIYPNEIRGDISFTDNLNLDKKNSDITLSYILHKNGYTRVEDESKQVKIIEAENIRYYPTKLFYVDKKTGVTFPENYDYNMMSYEFTNKDEKNIAKIIAQAFRPFLSRYGRIIHAENRILVQDIGLNLKRLYGMIISLLDSESNQGKKI